MTFARPVYCARVVESQGLQGTCRSHHLVLHLQRDVQSLERLFVSPKGSKYDSPALRNTSESVNKTGVPMAVCFSLGASGLV